MTRICLVYNPAAGAYRADRLAALVAALEREGFAVTTSPTRRPGGPDCADADIVCVNGGDGTLRDTVQELGARAGEVPLCVAPLGTINLVARELGYHRDPGRFARALREAWVGGAERRVRAPLYALGDAPVVSCLSIGPDSHAVAQVSPALKKRIGRYAYAVALMRQLGRWERRAMAITGELADGTAFACRAEAAIVTHGAFYAGSFRLSAQSALAADAVELVAIPRATRTATALLIAAALLRLPVARLGLAEIRSCRRIDFGAGAGPVQVDGDHVPQGGHVVAPTGLTLTYLV